MKFLDDILFFNINYKKKLFMYIPQSNYKLQNKPNHKIKTFRV